MIDNIFKVVCGMNVYKEKKNTFPTIDPTQLQPIRGRPFLVSYCAFMCYKIIPIKNYVRAQADNSFSIQ